MSEIDTCPSTGLRHYYWPQGSCQYCGGAHPVLVAIASERDRLREENTRLRETSWRLMIAANDVDLGRSIHNSREPDQPIEGPVWDILREASAAVRATLSPVEERKS
jgi:hypothetical protein